jgi:signal peptidase I
MKKNKYKIKIIVVTIMILMIAALAFAKPFRVTGDCMEPAIMDGQLYFLNRISPYLGQYQIGDIILFKHDEKVCVSRIVALETNKIQITEGSVVVNNVTLQDTGIHRSCSNWKHGVYAVDKPFQVPLDHVFVLSDNLSAQHDDSRIFGPVSKESIIGLVW